MPPPPLRISPLTSSFLQTSKGSPSQPTQHRRPRRVGALRAREARGWKPLPSVVSPCRHPQPQHKLPLTLPQIHWRAHADEQIDRRRRRQVQGHQGPSAEIDISRTSRRVAVPQAATHVPKSLSHTPASHTINCRRCHHISTQHAPPDGKTASHTHTHTTTLKRLVHSSTLTASRRKAIPAPATNCIHSTALRHECSPFYSRLRSVHSEGLFGVHGRLLASFRDGPRHTTHAK
ncbi:uncharacterized protein J3D65DRAFT_259201 [Phyllosticta citribraziliensis]|uniref:Uncharacterized protein n=1 Tax=Phyllosticta citribraziliensis TaxID=989973 RepID=A0ABR1M435_9PEZI